MDSAAQPVSRFENGDRVTRMNQTPRRREAGDPRSDNDYGGHKLLDVFSGVLSIPLIDNMRPKHEIQLRLSEHV